MGYFERVARAANHLISVSMLDGLVDMDQLISPDYRTEFKTFQEDTLDDELMTLFNIIRTMFGDYVLPSVKLDDIISLSTLNRQAVITALNIAYELVEEVELV